MDALHGCAELCCAYWGPRFDRRCSPSSIKAWAQPAEQPILVFYCAARTGGRMPQLQTCRSIKESGVCNNFKKQNAFFLEIK